MGRHKESAESRWWKYVRQGVVDKCWAWTGAVDSRGYPRFYDGEKQVDAAKWYWERLNGVNGSRFERCKKMRCCVNPKHLRPNGGKDG